MLDKQNLRTFVLGGLAGAIAGILLTPRSGRELRGSLASRAGEVRERGRETYFEAREKAQEKFSENLDSGNRESGDREVYPEDPESSRRLFSLEEPWEEIPGSDPPLEGEASVGRTPSGAIPMTGDSAPAPRPLRDMSRNAPADAPEVTDEKTEDLKRRIEETKARLRRRREVSGEDRDV